MAWLSQVAFLEIQEAENLVNDAEWTLIQVPLEMLEDWSNVQESHQKAAICFYQLILSYFLYLKDI